LLRIGLYFLIKETYFYVPLLPATTSLRNSWEEQTTQINIGKSIEKTEIQITEPSEIYTTLYSSVVLFVNNEALLIWNRYNTMLAANSLIAALLGVILAKGALTIVEATLILCGSLFGLYLSWQWRGLTKRGWELEHYWVKYAESFKWNGLKNPMDPYSEWCIKAGRGEGLADWISVYAHRVINLFMLGYSIAVAIALIILAYQLFPLLMLIKL